VGLGFKTPKEAIEGERRGLVVAVIRQGARGSASWSAGAVYS
jgi:hypothetical protein